MKKLAQVLVLILIVSSMIGCSAKKEGKEEVKGDKDLEFVLITMDSMDEHWLSVKAGAEQKIAELERVNLTFRAPSGKVDPNEQTRMTEDAINQKADAILIAPSDKTALAPVIDRAHDAGIPVVIIDSPADTENYISFLATDNYAAGALAADTLAEKIGSKGKVAIVNAQPGSGTSISRESGFTDKIKESYSDIEVVSIQYCNGDKTKALDQATDIMTANPDLVGFYGCNEGSTVGICKAVEEAGKVDTISIIGFDKSSDIITAIENNILDASMVQSPNLMGYKGVEMAYNHIKGEEVEKEINTGVKVITADNVDTIK
ncbi:LacI family transcriptional regulator [Vallitalea longa]|uniref:LacI family transcriptional regulator n=1 Tax=Vallitalea longa TaxID=2936439 RepID=A0A9W5YFG1_9FIRM|nr:ABC transporter substrate-binding protein [Vallitalea longa]GKX31535.1 LacI family transcriptional regulator [Vallitalea longa]